MALLLPPPPIILPPPPPSPLPRCLCVAPSPPLLLPIPPPPLGMAKALTAATAILGFSLHLPADPPHQRATTSVKSTEAMPGDEGTAVSGANRFSCKPQCHHDYGVSSTGSAPPVRLHGAPSAAPFHCPSTPLSLPPSPLPRCLRAAPSPQLLRLPPWIPWSDRLFEITRIDYE